MGVLHIGMLQPLEGCRKGDPAPLCTQTSPAELSNGEYIPQLHIQPYFTSHQEALQARQLLQRMRKHALETLQAAGQVVWAS